MDAILKDLQTPIRNLAASSAELFFSGIDLRGWYGDFEMLERVESEYTITLNIDQTRPKHLRSSPRSKLHLSTARAMVAQNVRVHASW